MRTFTVDDLLNVNQFTRRCPWDISPDGGLLAGTLSQGKRRVPYDAGYGGGNGAYIVLIDVKNRRVHRAVFRSADELGRAVVS